MKTFWMGVLVLYFSIAVYGAGITKGVTTTHQTAVKLGYGEMLDGEFVWNNEIDFQINR